MGPEDFFKSATDSLDKITDILNVGRLIFYTSAGFCALLPVAMTLRLLAYDPHPTYWRQFTTDLVHCFKHGELWAASVIFGFVIVTLANMVVINRFAQPPSSVAEKDSYTYSYPRLYSGGVSPKEGSAKDYAAWLVSEYYRYVEIAVFIPYSILLSLPVYSLYSFVYLIRTAWQSKAFVLHSGYVAFALWMLGTIVAWKVIWPAFWLPRVAEPTYQAWVSARRSAIEGLAEFAAGSRPSEDKDKTQPSK